jgi:hypothetical protein
MHQIVEPPTPNPVSPPPVSRRALLEGTAGAGFVAAAGWGSAALRPRDAHAADPAQGAGSARQIAAFRIRQAAAQAGARQTLAVVQRARRSAARPHGGNDGQRRTTGRATTDACRCDRADAARAVCDLAGRARGRRSRSQHAAPAPRSATRRGRIRARHDGVVRSLTPEFARVWKSRADDAIVLAARFQKRKRNPTVGSMLLRWKKLFANPLFTCENMKPA